MKKRLVPILVFSILISLHINAQNTCLPGGITFSTQGQIDSFSINYPGCTIIEGDVLLDDPWWNFDNLNGLSDIVSIEGDLLFNSFTIFCNPGTFILNDTIGLQNLQTIGGNLNLYIGTINNFNGFENLQTIGGDFTITSMELNSFSGLGNLQAIGEDFDISPCIDGQYADLYGIQNFSGLGSLESIGDDFRLRSTVDFIDFTGLENLTSIGGRMDFNIINGYTSPELSSLTGLQNLEYIGSDLNLRHSSFTNISALANIETINGDLNIQALPLTSLDGLQNIDTVRGNVKIWTLDTLQDLNGLGNLRHIGGFFWLSGNDELPDFSGIENLHSVDSILTVTGNDSLASLNGLVNLDHLTMDSLVITNNPNLSICNVEPICDFLENIGKAEISGNSPGCNSKQEVEDSCETTAVDGVSLEDRIKIFPNPTSGIVQFETDKTVNCSIRVMNIEGKIIDSFHLDDRHHTNLTQFPNGLYLIEIRSDHGLVMKKIIKE